MPSNGLLCVERRDGQKAQARENPAGFVVEAGEIYATEVAPLVGDGAICEIATLGQERQAFLHGPAIRNHRTGL
jgi:hypothetical protein